VKCRALPLSVLYSVRCLEGITFQIELKVYASVQNPDFFAAK